MLSIVKTSDLIASSLLSLLEDLLEFFLGGQLSLVVTLVEFDPVPGDGGCQEVLREVKVLNQRQSVGCELGAQATVQVENLKF